MQSGQSQRSGILPRAASRLGVLAWMVAVLVLASGLPCPGQTAGQTRPSAGSPAGRPKLLPSNGTAGKARAKSTTKTRPASGASRVQPATQNPGRQTKPSAKLPDQQVSYTDYDDTTVEVCAALESACDGCGACPEPLGSAVCQRVVNLQAEGLLWRSKGDHVPPLVTTNPNGTPRDSAGLLTTPSTQILFGDSGLHESMGSGHGLPLTAGRVQNCATGWKGLSSF